jgi:quercetin dioxygenase-like cupin family protein
MSVYLTRAKFPAPPDETAVAADWRTRGYSCHVFTDPPGRQWNDFVHDCNELLTVAEGRLELLMDGERITVEPGDEVFIPRDALHSVHNISDGESRWLFGYD